MYPKLRPLDVKPFNQNGQPYLLLRDPLELSDRVVAVPRFLGPALAHCDGAHNIEAIGAAVAREYGFRISANVLQEMVAALDEALLLDNDRASRAEAAALQSYRDAPFRPPALAGRAYPAAPDELRRLLQGYIDAANVEPDPTPGFVLVSPHIDYERGGLVYAKVWQRARRAVEAAELAVIFGTDHAGSHGQVTLTRQHYATPFGTLPTATDVVNTLAETIGPAHSFAEELHHRAEHSIELACVWLHYLRKQNPCEIVPVLCGSFGHFLEDGATPQADHRIAAFLNALQRETQGRRVLYVAAGDLAHVGPAFGGEPLTAAARATLRAADNDLIEHMRAGDAERFFAAIKRAQDRNNICGLSPIYLTLRAAGAMSGEMVAYEQCPADEENASAVTVCGIVLKQL